MRRRGRGAEQAGIEADLIGAARCRAVGGGGGSDGADGHREE